MHHRASEYVRTAVVTVAQFGLLHEQREDERTTIVERGNMANEREVRREGGSSFIHS